MHDFRAGVVVEQVWQPLKSLACCGLYETHLVCQALAYVVVELCWVCAEILRLANLEEDERIGSLPVSLFEYFCCLGEFPFYNDVIGFIEELHLVLDFL